MSIVEVLWLLFLSVPFLALIPTAVTAWQLAKGKLAGSKAVTACVLQVFLVLPYVFAVPLMQSDEELIFPVLLLTHLQSLASLGMMVWVFPRLKLRLSDR